MEELVVGVDLCDEYTQISCPEEEKLWTIPTVICRNRNTEEWYVGADAYAHTLKGDGIIVDKLLNLAAREGTATLGEVRYEGRELLWRFQEQALEQPRRELERQGIRTLVFAVRSLNPRLNQVLRECGSDLKLAAEQIHVISHAEAFIYYVLSQKKEIWNNTVGMFDLSESGLRYYEMKVQRGLKRTLVVAEYEEMEESFDLDILKTPSGARLGDKILCSCASRLMARKAYSAVFLTGKGFEEQDWAEDFMKQVCANRRVYMEQGVFARGAALKAADSLREKTSYPYTLICDGRLKSTVSMDVLHRGQETTVTVASAGDSWYDRVSVIDVIPDHQESIDFAVTAVDSRKKKQIAIPLDGFPRRYDRTMRVRIRVTFLDEKTMEVVLKDQGFGELFAATGAEIRKEVML